MSLPTKGDCPSAGLTDGYILRLLSPDNVARAEEHISACPECRRKVEVLGPVVAALAEGAGDILTPSPVLRKRLAHRISGTGGTPIAEALEPEWHEPDWERVAPGIECKLLASDSESQRVSMLVRLAPGASYPPHTHAGIEELHLLDGELWIDKRKLYPGDYNRGLPGARDERVWTETGCTCVLITSSRDILR